MNSYSVYTYTCASTVMYIVYIVDICLLDICRCPTMYHSMTELYKLCMAKWSVAMVYLIGQSSLITIPRGTHTIIILQMEIPKIPSINIYFVPELVVASEWWLQCEHWSLGNGTCAAVPSAVARGNATLLVAVTTPLPRCPVT